MKTIKERAEIYGIESASLLCSGFSDSQRERQAKVYAKVYEKIATEQKVIDIEKSLEYWERRLRGIKKELMSGYDMSVTSELVKYKQAMEE